MLCVIAPRGIAAAECTDPDALAAVRAAIAAQCDCATLGDGYATCAASLIRQASTLHALDRPCRAQAKRCVSASICGRSADAVTCCHPGSGGRSRCKVTSAVRCAAAHGCTGVVASCCDACEAGGCATTTTTTTTPTTIAPGQCGVSGNAHPELCPSGQICSCGSPNTPCNCICPYTTTTTLILCGGFNDNACGGTCLNGLTCSSNGAGGCVCGGGPAPCGKPGLMCSSNLSCPVGLTCQTTPPTYPFGPNCPGRTGCACQ